MSDFMDQGNKSTEAQKIDAFKVLLSRLISLQEGIKVDLEVLNSSLGQLNSGLFPPIVKVLKDRENTQIVDLYTSVKASTENAYDISEIIKNLNSKLKLLFD